MAKPKGKKDHSVQIYRIHQTQKTWRYLIVCGAVVLGIKYIVEGYVEVAKVDEPAWLRIVLTIIFTIAACAAAPTTWIFKLKSYMSKDHQRLVELEALVDPSRESSGLTPTGDPEDENI